MRREFGVILQREAIRQSRRWQTYALRFAFSAVLIFLVWYALDNLHGFGINVGELAHFGRGLFRSYIALQLCVACFVAPILVATGILEEREAKTLDLLAISGLRPQQILNGKVGSRLLALLTIIAAGAPILALIVSFGGTSVWQVLNATVNTAVIATVLGVIGGFCALFAKKGPIPPLVGAMMFIVPPVGMLPYLYEVFGGPDAEAHHFSPLESMWSDHPASALVGLLYIPVIWQVSRLSLPVFRIVTSDESTEEFGMLSPDFWVLERFKRRSWLLAIGAFVAWALWVPIVIILNREGLEHRFSGPMLFVGAVLSWATLVVGTRIFLITWMAGARRVRRYLADPFSGRLFYRQRKRSMVWGNPVTWRELSTRGSAGMRLLVTGATLIWLFITLFSLFMTWTDPHLASGVHTTLAMMAFFLAFTGAMLTTTSTIIEERLSRTLPLLLLTPMSRFRIVFGKLQAVWWRALPLIAMGAFLILAADDALYSEHGTNWHHHDLGPNLFAGSRLAQVAIALAWMYSALTNHVLAIVLVGLVVRPVRLAWPAIPAVVFAWWMGPWLTLVAGYEIGVLTSDITIYENLMYWFPFMDNEATLCADGGMPLSFVAATSVQVGVALFLTFLIRLRLNVLIKQ